MRSQDKHPLDPASARKILSRLPGALEAMAQRCAELPEYRAWLAHFNPGLLRVVEQYGRFPGSPSSLL